MAVEVIEYPVLNFDYLKKIEAHIQIKLCV